MESIWRKNVLALKLPIEILEDCGKVSKVPEWIKPVPGVGKVRHDAYDMINI